MNYAKHIGCVEVVLVSLSGFALTETVNGVTWTYTTSNGEASLGIDSSSSPAVPSSTSGVIVIPSVLGGYSVTTLGAYAFRNCTRLTSVTVPNSVTRIQDSAFNGCSGLKEITLPFVGLQRGNRRKREALFGYIFGNSSYSGGIKMTQHCTESSSGSSFYIPSSLRRVVVTDETLLGYGAFSGLSGLTSIVIGSSVTSIESAVFKDSSGLRDVTVPQCVCGSRLSSVFPSAYQSITNAVILAGVTSIGDYAFSSCRGLTSVTIPDSVTSIGNYAFSGCRGLTSVSIPDSVISIGNFAFDECSGLTSVTIPDSVTSIGNYAFDGCNGLMSISVEANNPTYSSANGLLLSKEGKVLIQGVNGIVTIPDGVTSIGNNAFRACSGLTSVTIPNSVTSIGYSAFYGCSGLMSITVGVGNPTYSSANGLLLSGDGKTLIQGVNGTVTIPDDVTSIGDSAFSGCSGLTSVTIGNGVTSIGSGAFNKCRSLASVTIPDSVTSIGASAFYGCSELRSVTIGNGVTSVGDYAFSDCIGLTSVTIPDSVTSIGNSAFSDCGGLMSVTIPDSVTRIGDWAFSDCSRLTSATIPDSVTSIGWRAFYNCSGLTSVTIGNGVTSIGPYVFSGCSGLMRMVIGNGVKSIETSAFSGCDGLRDVTVPQCVCDSSLSSVFPSVYQSITNVVILTGVTNIGDSAFEGCGGLTGITIPDSVTSIGAQAFYNCTNLLDVTISDSVANIGYRAFYNTPFHANLPDGLIILGTVVYEMRGACPTAVMIPEGVTSIGSSAFSGCSGLTSVTIPTGVIDIGERAFLNCKGLTSVTIPDGVTSIGDYAFRTCSGLTNVTIPNSVTNIGATGFYGCSSLTSVTIPNGVTSIGSSTFRNCRSLTEVMIPDSVTNIDYAAFGNCNSLTNITISKNVITIGNEAFVNCSSLATVLYEGNAPTMGSSVFTGVASGCCAYVRRASTGWDVTIPGRWNGIAIDYVHYVVTMDANGGTCETPSLDVSDGTSVDVLPIPTWGNAVFLGWFTEAEGGEQVQIVTAPTTLHAHWLTEVAKPIILSDHGSVFRSESCEVSITCATDGAKIFYTDDGTTPKRYDDYLYAGPVTITDTTTFKAVAVVGGLRSAYTTVTITKHNLTLGEALNVGEGVVLATDLSLPWHPVYDSYAKLGDATARSCAIGNRTNTWLTATVSGAGTMSFWCKVSCEHDGEDILTCDRLMVYTNGVEITDWRMDGETDWTQRALAFKGGENTVKWVYYKDKSDTGGEDCAWVDGIEWVPSAEAMLAVWLAERNLTAEARAANGRTAAECYALGLDPADATNDFRIVYIEMVDGKPKVEWEPKVNRWTGVEIQAVLKGAERLDGEWKAVEGATAEEKAAMRFFKVVVEVQ